jgi:formate C-acetyltransferase
MQLKSVPISDYSKRISSMKKNLIDTPFEICIERAKLITDFYKNSDEANPIIRFAKAMKFLLSNMTLKIWDGEFIVGNRCTKYKATPLYPEVRVDSLELDIDNYDSRLVQPLDLNEEEKSFIKEEVIPFWKNEAETVQERFSSKLTPELVDLMEKLVYIVDTQLTNGIGHFFPGHENLLKFGIEGLINKVKNQMQKLQSSSQVSDENNKGLIFLKSVLVLLRGARIFIKRFANFAKNLAKKEVEELRKKELLEISEICNHISIKPPKSLKEALQLIYFNHLITGLEDGGFAISIGRLDQYLYPFYREDIQKGELSDKEVKFLIQNFFIKLSSLWNYILSKGVIAGEGPPIAENLVVGGVLRNGEDATNELSYLILEAYTELKTVQPTFSVRIHEKTPSEFIDEVAKSIKEGTSIALFNDELMIPALKSRGYTLEDARHYAPIGCVEPQHPYKSFGSTNANQFNIVKCLELTLNKGKDMITRSVYGLASNSINSYEKLWDSFLNQMKFFIKKMVETMYLLDESIAELNPQPFLSATTDDCITRGLDVTQGGAIYNFTGPQLVGLATVADSLATIKKYVFDEKILSLEEITEILKKNFRGTYKGKKGKEWREIFVNKVPKFGNDDDYVDQIAVDVTEAYCNEIYKHINYRGGKFNPGIYSTSFHLAFGIFTGASADGRKSKEPLSNGLGPTIGMDRNGLTSILNSVKKLPHHLMTNGNSLLLGFNPNSMELDIFNSLIDSFFEKIGGYQIQSNVITRETLLDAQKDPNSYRGLVVRIAGYSVLFPQLSKAAQDEIIGRTLF